MVALYRHFNEFGVLLYVGIAVNPTARLSAHMDDAHWRDRIAEVKIENFPDRASAHAAEIKAIQTEEPLYNVRHQKRGSVGWVLQKFWDQCDLDEIEDSIDDFNATPCSRYRDECLTMLKSLADQVGIDFETQIQPRLVERDLPTCNDDCSDCRENSHAVA